MHWLIHLGFGCLVTLSLLWAGFGAFIIQGQQDAITKFKPTEARVTKTQILEYVDYPDADAEVGDSGVRVSYQPDVTYEYTVDGTLYTGNQLTPNPFTLEAEEEAQAYLEKYPEGQQVWVYYNEFLPYQAYLERYVDWVPYGVTGLGLFFLAAFLWAWISWSPAIRRGRRRIHDEWVTVWFPRITLKQQAGQWQVFLLLFLSWGALVLHRFFLSPESAKLVWPLMGLIGLGAVFCAMGVYQKLLRWKVWGDIVLRVCPEEKHLELLSLRPLKPSATSDVMEATLDRSGFSGRFSWILLDHDTRLVRRFGIEEQKKETALTLVTLPPADTVHFAACWHDSASPSELDVVLDDVDLHHGHPHKSGDPEWMSFLLPPVSILFPHS